MKFRRKADQATGTAKQWLTHADHPKVRPAKCADFPTLKSPERLGVVDGPKGPLLVIPGDWIVTLDDATTPLVLQEREFRQRFEAVAV